MENDKNGFRSSGPLRAPAPPAGPGQAFGIRPSACGLRRCPDHFLWENDKNGFRFSVFGLRAPAPPAGPGQAFGIRPSAFGLRRYPDHFLVKMTKTVFGFRSSGPCPSRWAGPSFRDSAFGFRSSEVPGPFFGENDKRFSVFGPLPLPLGRAKLSGFGLRLSVFGGTRTIFWWENDKNGFRFSVFGPLPLPLGRAKLSGFGLRLSVFGGTRTIFWWKIAKTALGFRFSVFAKTE